MLRDMVKDARWLKSQQGARQLSRMRRDRRQWALKTFDEGRLLRVGAERYQVPMERVPARRVWRSSKHPALFSVGAAAVLCGVSRKTIYNRLSLYKAEFPPRYRRGKDHPRRLRALTVREVNRLQALTAVGYRSR